VSSDPWYIYIGGIQLPTWIISCRFSSCLCNVSSTLSISNDAKPTVHESNDVAESTVYGSMDGNNDVRSSTNTIDDESDDAEQLHWHDAKMRRLNRFHFNVSILVPYFSLYNDLQEVQQKNLS